MGFGAIAALTYGWVTPNHPDVTNRSSTLANVRRFLIPSARRASGAVLGFWISPQHRIDAEKKIFDEALGCMGDVYASAMANDGRAPPPIPKRPEEYEACPMSGITRTGAGAAWRPA